MLVVSLHVKENWPSFPTGNISKFKELEYRWKDQVNEDCFHLTNFEIISRTDNSFDLHMHSNPMQSAYA